MTAPDATPVRLPLAPAPAASGWRDAVRPLLFVVPVLALLAFAPRVPVLAEVLCVVAFLFVGDMWLRALVREPITQPARLGLGTATGMATFPLVALVLDAVGTRIEARSLAVGVSLVAVLLAVVVGAFPHTARIDPDDVATPGFLGGFFPQPGGEGLRVAAAVLVPLVVSVVIGGSAVRAYQRLPHPVEPGYTSVALGGWAASIARPVDIPAAGVAVPLRVSSLGQPAHPAVVRVQVGTRVVGSSVVRIDANATSDLLVRVPAPPNGCLYPIKISLGAGSTIFYGRGPAAC